MLTVVIGVYAHALALRAANQFMPEVDPQSVPQVSQPEFIACGLNEHGEWIGFARK